MNRKIPLSTRCSILFSGIISQFGWLFFGFGLIFYWVFAMNADLSFLQFRGKIITVTGIVTNSVSTGASENERLVYRNSYVFTTVKEKNWKDNSYSTGRDLEPGQSVTIEYPEGKPQVSRIQGMRRKLFGPSALFVIIFPFVGLSFIVFGMKSSLRTLRLYRNGLLTRGKLVAKEATNTQINNSTVYKMTFRFKDRMGREFEVTERTHLSHLLQDEREEELLYLKDNPEYAVMLDTVPSAPSIDGQGNIASPPLKKTLLVMILPVLTIIGHGAYVLIRYVGIDIF